jgi:hypothetical protein
MFQVEWLQEALDDLVSIWTNADSADRAAIVTAIRIIDQQLSSAPHEQGESREGNKRVLFALPLGLQIQVEFDQQLVLVGHLWHIERRRRDS